MVSLYFCEITFAYWALLTAFHPSTACAGKQQAKIVEAVYSRRLSVHNARPRGDRRKDCDMEIDSLVMSATRRQWLERIKGKATSPEGIGVRGQVQASGRDVSRRSQVKVVTPEKLRPLEALVRVNIGQLCGAAFGEEFSGLYPLPIELPNGDAFVGPALTKPCFSPFEPGIAAVATEEHPLQEHQQPYLMVIHVQSKPGYSISKLAYVQLEAHASAIQWVTADELLVAAGSDLMILQLQLPDGTLRVASRLPRMHQDSIRDIQKHGFQTTCLSGGYCGSIFVTDIAQQ